MARTVSAWGGGAATDGLPDSFREASQAVQAAQGGGVTALATTQLTDRDKASIAVAMLRCAFREGHRSPGTPMGGYRGKGRDQNPADAKEAPLERGSREWWEREIQRQGLNPTRVCASEPMPPGFSRPPINGDMSGQVLRSLWQLGPLTQCWLYHHYGHGQRRKESTARLSAMVLTSYLNKAGAIRGKAQGVVRFMVTAHVYRSATPSQWDANCPAQWAERFEIRREAWNRRYKPHYQAIYDHMRALDRRALVALFDKYTEQSQ